MALLCVNLPLNQRVFFFFESFWIYLYFLGIFPHLFSSGAYCPSSLTTNEPEPRPSLHCLVVSLAARASAGTPQGLVARALCSEAPPRLLTRIPHCSPLTIIGLVAPSWDLLLPWGQPVDYKKVSDHDTKPTWIFAKEALLVCLFLIIDLLYKMRLPRGFIVVFMF